MDAAELITYCSLAGTVVANEQLTRDGQLTDFYLMRLIYQGKRITLQYHKSGDDLTFIKGTTIKVDSMMGTGLTTIHGFKHLMKTLDIS